jgi:hypothetical protein
MSVDVEIYMNNILKFFRENPKDLLNLVPKSFEEKFYLKIREVAKTNFEKNGEAGLTQKQLLNICRELNQARLQSHSEPNSIIVMTPFGGYSLN